MKILKSHLWLILLLLNSICYSQQKGSSSISIDEFKNRLINDKDIVVLDVRTPEELNGPLGRINHSINIPIQNLEQRIDELNSFKGKEIIVICRTQNRSSIAVKILEKYGFNSSNVLGGVVEYNR